MQYSGSNIVNPETRSQQSSFDKKQYSEGRSHQSRSDIKVAYSETRSRQSSFVRREYRYCDASLQQSSFDNKDEKPLQSNSESDDKGEYSEARSQRPSSGYAGIHHGCGRPKERTGQAEGWKW